MIIIIIIYSRHLDIFTKFLISGQEFCLDLSPDSQKTHKVSSKIIGRDRNIDVSWWTSEKSRKKKSKRHLDRKACVFWDQILNCFWNPLQQLRARERKWRQTGFGRGSGERKAIFRNVIQMKEQWKKNVLRCGTQLITWTKLLDLF